MVAPTDGATMSTLPATLDVTVSDADGEELDVTFFGRPASGGTGADFTVVAIPDTQH